MPWNIAQQTARMRLAAEVTFLSMRWLTPQNWSDMPELIAKIITANDLTAKCLKQAASLKIYQQSQFIYGKTIEKYSDRITCITNIENGEELSRNVIAMLACCNLMQQDVAVMCTDFPTENWAKLNEILREILEVWLFPASPEAEELGMEWFCDTWTWEPKKGSEKKKRKKKWRR